MGIQIPRVTKCCFCVPLRIATLLIGYISIVISCLTIGIVCFYIYAVARYVREHANKPVPEHSPEDIQKMALSLYLSFGYYVIVFLYNFVINVLLVVGVHKTKPQYLKVYINTAYFLLILASVLIVLTFVFMGFIATLPSLKWAVVLFGCIIIVRSTYLDMLEQQNKPRTIEMQDLYITPQISPQGQGAPLIA